MTLIFGFASTLKKQAQLNEEGHLLLHDVTCLWLWVRAKLNHQFPADVITKHDELFMNGSLASIGVMFLDSL